MLSKRQFHLSRIQSSSHTVFQGNKINQQQQNIVFIKITQQNMKATQKLPDQTTICSALSILAQQQLNFLLQLSLLLPVLLLVFDPCLFCSLDLIFQTIHFFTLVVDDRLKLRIGSFLHLQFCLNILQCSPLLCNLDAHILKKVIGFLCSDEAQHV